MNQTIVDIYAFFDGVALTQRPNNYLLGNNYQPLSSHLDLRKTRPFTMPVHPNKPEIIASFASAYTKEELTEYIDLLKSALGKKSFALNLIGNKHAITLAYDATTTRWILIDANHLPSVEYIHSNLLADSLWTDLLNDSRMVLVMGSQVNVLAQDQQDMQLKFDVLQKSKAWSSLHDADKMKRTYYSLYEGCFENPELYGTPSMLADFYKRKDDAPIKDRDLLKMAIERKEYGIAAQLIIERGLSFCEYDLFNKVFSSIVKSQQNNLLEALTIDQKVTLIMTGSHIWLSLPESERIPVFLRLDPVTQANCLAELSQEHALHGRLSVFSTFVTQATLKRRLVVDEAHANLFLTLSLDDKQALIDAACFDPKGQMIFFLMLSDSERLSVFSQIESLAQSKLLMSLTEEQVELKPLLISSLRTDQKTNIINAADDINKYDVFSMFTEQNQLAMFDRLSDSIQINLLKHNMACNTPALELERFIATLSVEQKITIINKLSIYSDSQLILNVFDSLTEQEQLSMFAKLDNTIQLFLLRKMTMDSHADLLEQFIATLSFDQKISCIKSLNLDNTQKDYQLVGRIFESIPTTMRVDAFQKIKSGMYGFISENMLIILMSSLTKAEQFELISPMNSDYDKLPLSQIKNIILDKLKHLSQGMPANSYSFFDKMKVKIMDAETKDEITEVFYDLLDFLKHPVKQTDLVCASAELTTDEATEKTLGLTLTEILEPLGLTKATLTSSSLKRVYRTIHTEASGSGLDTCLFAKCIP